MEVKDLIVRQRRLFSVRIHMRMTQNGHLHFVTVQKLVLKLLHFV